MKLSEIKNILNNAESVEFQLENGVNVPKHFHVTEIGLITKHFIDCGGTERHEKVVNFQLWNANDISHRLAPSKLLNIIELSQNKLNIGDLEVEIEYQTDTIGKFNLGYNGNKFILENKKTNCLASESCGTTPKQMINEAISNIENTKCCTPGGGCC